MSYDYQIIDMQQETLEDVVERFKTLMRSVGGSTYKGDYYCGIATDPDDRFYDHERKHWKIKWIVGVIDCGTKKRCCDVEELMDDEGFDVGEAAGRGPGDDTRYVYLVEKGERVKPGSVLEGLRDSLREAVEAAGGREVTLKRISKLADAIRKHRQ